MKLKKALFAAAIIGSVGKLVKQHGEPVIDGLAAATSTNTNLSPTFNGKVLAGPNVIGGARLLEGQTLKLLITVGNPWTNNSITMDFTPALDNTSLTQNSTSPSQPSWIWTWKVPRGASQVGHQKVTFLATFTQDNGSENVYRPGLSIALGPHAPPVFKKISRLDVQVGQPVSFDVSATDPENEAVAISVDSLPNGASLSATKSSSGNWISHFNWSPNAADLGEQKMTFTAKDTFAGDNNSSSMPVTISVHPPVANNENIQSVTITSANWAATTKKLQVKGKVTHSANHALPTGMSLQLSTASGISLDSPTAVVTRIKNNGTWKANLKLTSGVIPCTVMAQLYIDGLAANTPATRQTKGARASFCTD